MLHGHYKHHQHLCLMRGPQVDPVRNLVFVRGQVPGPAGQAVLLRDAFSAQPQRQAAWQLPFPTYVPLAGAAKDAPTVSAGRISSKDPYRAYNEESDYFEVSLAHVDDLHGLHLEPCWGCHPKAAPKLSMLTASVPACPCSGCMEEV